MDEHEFLARRFEEHRPHLRAVAHRVLGSAGLAEDAVRETWLRVSRAGPDGVESFGGWLRTVVGQVSLDILRTRAAQGDDPLGPSEPWEAAAEPGEDGAAPGAGVAHGPGRGQEAFRGDTVGIALLAVLDRMAPAERLAFVLHDLFAVPFDEIAPIVRRSPDATRQLARRARRRVQGAGAGEGAPPEGGDGAARRGTPAGGADGSGRAETAPGARSDVPYATSAAAVTAGGTGRRSAIASAFLAASRGEDFDALLALFDPDVVLRADAAAVAAGAAEEVRGAVAVADVFTGRLGAARPALVDGSPGLVRMHRGRPRIAFALTVAYGTIVGIDVIADRERLDRLKLEPLDD